IKVDRKGSGLIIVPRPCLSVVGGIQTDLLPELADSLAREDGFTDRVLFGFPEEVEDDFPEASVDEAVLDAVDAVFQALYAIAPTVTAEGNVRPHRVRFDREAMALWKAWYAEHLAEQRHPLFPPRLRGPWAKMPGQLGRLALILHVVPDPARGVEQPATAETLA